MSATRLVFEDFLLDPGERRLTRDGAPVAISARYFDALALLVREGGRLVAKDRFMAEVWRGVPVTDEALTQCIRALRRALGDVAARPRFIETVPRHGYRFIAPVRAVADPAAPVAPARRDWRDWREALRRGGAGTLGAGLAGMLGGLVYGFAAASGQGGAGGASALLVVLWVAMLTALAGGAGVAFGIAGATLASGRAWRWSPLGGAIGGLVIGGIVKLLGLDAFTLLLGRPNVSLAGVTGAAEGLALGGAVGLGGWLAARARGSLARRVAIAAATGAVGGALIPLAGGRLFGGSLDLLAGARLSLDPLGAPFGEAGLGPIAQCVTGALEGALFAAGIVGAMRLAARRG